MNKFTFNLTTLCFIFASIAVKAQVTTTPAIVVEGKQITIHFDASQGSAGLKNFTGDVYAHTGVITDKSTSTSDWKYVKAEWTENIADCKMTRTGQNAYQLIIPEIRAYYGVPAGEEIRQLAFVFRSADGTKEGKTASGGDIFVTLNEDPFTPTTPIVKARPTGLKEGITYYDNSSVRFLLYAPGKSHVHLIGDFNNWERDNDYQLYKDGDYWWYELSTLNDNEEYGFQYLIDNDFRIGDPYCEKILDPNNDKYIPASTYPNLKTYPVGKTSDIVSVFQINQPVYNWQITDFKGIRQDKLVIYELLLRDFTETSDINGLMTKLDYLQALGVNAIELMPVQEFDGNDSWGYNPAYYFALDKAYGTKNMYKQLIDACHARGMAVILDVVYNHMTGASPFAKLYWNAATYKTAANNPWFNVDAPHPYSVFHDLNHESQRVRTLVKRNLDFLLKEYKIDGFRFDLTKGFTQKSSTESTASNYDASRIAILKDYNDQIKSSNPEAYMIIEHFCNWNEEKELNDYGMMVWANKNEAYCETAMGWNTSSKTDFNGINGWTRSWSYNNPVGYMESHDEERTMYKAKTYGATEVKGSLATQMERAALNAAFFLTIPGPKMIWQFGEMGYDISINENGRIGKKPLHWEYLEDANRKQLHDTYSKLLTLRSKYAAAFDNASYWTMQVSGSDWDNGRRIMLDSPDLKMVVLGNFKPNASVTMTANFPSTGTWYNLLDNTSENISNTATNYTLAANSFKIFTNKEIASGIENEQSRGFSIYTLPNQLIIDSLEPIILVKIYTIDGRLVKTVQGTTRISTADVSRGCYIVKVQSSKAMHTGKILKR